MIVKNCDGKRIDKCFGQCSYCKYWNFFLDPHFMCDFKEKSRELRLPLTIPDWCSLENWGKKEV